jgi:hypothetical protein
MNTSQQRVAASPSETGPFNTQSNVQAEQSLPPTGQRIPLVSQVYSSNYLYAADLHGEAKLVEITGVAEVVLNGAKKLAVYFASFDKPLVLNKTNARTIAGLHGDDPNAWLGKKVELYRSKVRFNDELVDCIRIRPPLEAPGLEKGTLQ